MSGIFKILGVLLACYAVRALTTGAVYARSGVWGRTFRREEHAWQYWSALIVYALLSLALVFVF